MRSAEILLRLFCPALKPLFLEVSVRRVQKTSLVGLLGLNFNSTNQTTTAAHNSQRDLHLFSLVFTFFLSLKSTPFLAADSFRNSLRILELVLLSSKSIFSAFNLCSVFSNEVSKSAMGSRVVAIQ